MRPIDADFFAEKLIKLWEAADEQGKAEIVSVIACIVTPILADTPTLEPIPPRCGKWVRETDRSGHWHCSECRAVWGRACLTMNYCPNCGARLYREEEQ